MSTLRIVVMGVSGCGKSTVGALLADRLGAPFLDGDTLHPQRNVDKMAAGIPLDDADRRPWLEEISRCFEAVGAQPLIIACSALKRAYRDIIRSQAPKVRFIQLNGTAEVLGERMAARPRHFMPTSLLQSQLQALEPLGPDEAGVVLDIQDAPEDLVSRAEEWLENNA